MIDYRRVFHIYNLALALLLVVYLIVQSQQEVGPRIFQIGMNRCGTRTLTDFFCQNGIIAVHNHLPQEPNGTLADSMHYRHVNKKPLIGSHFRKVVFFSDMESLNGKDPIYIAETYLEELYEQNPNSKFILNIRDRHDWIISRSTFIEGRYQKILINKLGMKKKELHNKWASDWNEHVKKVTEFFKDKPGRLLVFDIEKDSPEKLVDFLSPDYKLDAKYYGHVGKS